MRAIPRQEMREAPRQAAGLAQAGPSKKRVVIDLLSDNEDSDDEAVKVVPKAAPENGNPPETFVPYGLGHQPAPSRQQNNAVVDQQAWGEFMGDGGDEDDDAFGFGFLQPEDVKLNDHNFGFGNFDDFDEMDVRDPALADAMMEEYRRDQRQASVSNLQNNGAHLNVPDIRQSCINNAVEFFPGICRDYVSGLYDSRQSPSSECLISHILDQPSYPKAKDKQKTLKRKRELTEDEEAARRFGAVDRDMAVMKDMIRNILKSEYLETPVAFIDRCLKQNGHRLYSTYQILEEANRTHNDTPLYNKIKLKRKYRKVYTRNTIQAEIQSAKDKVARCQNIPHALGLLPMEVEVLEELAAAWRLKDKEDTKRQVAAELELAEEENLRRAETEGTMSECACCCGDFPLNRMVHCDSPEVMHWFCKGCALTSAETEIGKSKYELICMSMDGCTAGFSMDQRLQFLDEKAIIGLERNHQEANLRAAGFENLASCPFCPYAADYPPVEINREFECKRLECEKVSCRLCKAESHIPKSCEEHAKENGLSIRRQIEEAMSAALIRKCNKCGTPFVKEEGCNKMTCTAPNCRNVQCYVCSKSCGYDHFNDTTRGGKVGNCPLFESTEARHEDDVQKAAKEALERVRAEHPEYSEEELKVTVSDAVRVDDEKRKANPRYLIGVQHHRPHGAAIFGNGVDGRRGYIFGAGLPPPRPVNNDLLGGLRDAAEEMEDFLFEAHLQQQDRELQQPYPPPPMLGPRGAPGPGEIARLVVDAVIQQQNPDEIRRVRLERLDDQFRALAAAEGPAPAAGMPQRALALPAAAARLQVVPLLFDIDEQLRLMHRRVEQRRERAAAEAAVAAPLAPVAAVVPRPNTHPPNPPSPEELRARLNELRQERHQRLQQRLQHLNEIRAEQNRLNQQLLDARRQYGGHHG